MDLRFAIYDLLFCLLLLAGCGQPPVPKRPPVVEPTASGKEAAAAPSSHVVSGERGRSPAEGGPVTFAPVKIGILPLTELSSPAGAAPSTKLHAFVTMLDAFGSQVKAPGVLRFELYEYVPRSAQLKGPRLALWPDIDLTVPGENNKYWQDYLRAYEFELDVQASREKTYILEATCMTPDGKRLLAPYVLKNAP